MQEVCGQGEHDGSAEELEGTEGEREGSYYDHCRRDVVPRREVGEVLLLLWAECK
jgi:hypothetical protein